MSRVNWNFENTYFNLPGSFKEDINPVPVKNPDLVVFNEGLASELNLNFSNIDKFELSKIFSGNLLPEGSNSIAQAYAGHQFGHFTMLGDGRAVLIGEHTTKSNEKYDIQFKGSGKTAFSRNGDGRAALGPMLREYIISEAMNGLKIPTTRSLAVVKTGENIQRETSLQGAILTRVASSHIRVGTFQYIAARQKEDELKTLLDYTIDRHYPEIKDSSNKALDLLNLLIDRQCNLVVNWMRVGFIHGVMNTDNMSISGESIDYGPCAFMDVYDPQTVFSSIDLQGRYSYNNQPLIAHWNLSRFAETLIPLVNENRNKSIDMIKEKINNFPNMFKPKWLKMMRKKIGLHEENAGDERLINNLLQCMHKTKSDFTNTFLFLMGEKTPSHNDFLQNNLLAEWKKDWHNRIYKSGKSKSDSLKLMEKTNPKVIPRNHKVNEALENAMQKSDFKFFRNLVDVLENPYNLKKVYKDYQKPPLSKEKIEKTYCGT